MNNQMTINPDLINPSSLQILNGLLSLMIAYAVLRCLSLAQICKFLQFAKRCCAREITVGEANNVWRSVHQASYLFPGRAACLEMSLAFMVFSLSKRHSATWCIGTLTDCFCSHAWVEIENKPFREEEQVEKLFVKLVSV
jgi:hypothetical protein